MSNDISKANFIDNIGAYLEESNNNATYEVSTNDFDGCYNISPVIKTCIHQGSPWNNYVIEEHPNCPAGCVAVATALIMTHSKTYLEYHNRIIPFKLMVEAIYRNRLIPENSTLCDQSNDNNRAIHLPIPEPLSYEEAVDNMAYLIHQIGKDVHMEYSTNGSYAYSDSAYIVCRELEFDIPSGYANFNIEDITEYLRDGHIVYVRGSDLNVSGSGHAWVCDGCYFCVDPFDQTTILDTYVHCDWGWGGDSNGYYSGSVFSTSNGNYTPHKYFAVRREW